MVLFFLFPLFAGYHLLYRPELDETPTKRAQLLSCSVTVTGQNGMLVAVDAYNPPIKVTGMREMEWGYVIRAIQATHISLIADFYNASGTLVQSARCCITDRVSDCFTRQMARFKVPCDAESVQLSMEFNGAVTACTFLAPCAYFCCDCQQ